MSDEAQIPADRRTDPTADYRKYPKGPNFLLIVLVACGVLLVILATSVFLVGDKGKQLVPHPPSQTPNSMVSPLLPGVGSSSVVGA